MNIKYLLTVCVLLFTIIACNKIPNGFQSDQIRYKNNDITVKRGLILQQSDRINADGSTPPYQYKLLNLRKADGSPAPAEFTKEYEIQVFKPGMSFNAETDTTVALLNKKRELVKKAPMEFNETSGQFTFNRGSNNLPLGKYLFDIEMTNPTGTKLYPSLGSLNVIDPEGTDLFEVMTSAAAVFLDNTTTSAGIASPRITCRKISNDGARAILKIVDKNGVTFNPKAGEVLKRGDRPDFTNYAKFNPVIFTDTALICDFEVAPFPLVKYITPTTDWGYLMYYRIPSTAVNVDGFPAGKYSANPRWEFRLKLEGTYIIEVKMTDCVHR